MRDLVKRALGAVGRTGVGKNLVHAAVLADPGRARYATVERWPESLEGFEDLAFLFSSNQLSHGIVSLQLDEAALLYGLARRVPAEGAVVEIGRFKGGSTLLLASALPKGAELWSYDLHLALRADLSGPRLDSELVDALERYGLRDRVHLVVGDSRVVDPPPRAPALVFVDGDHTYEGARADYERWSHLVSPGGHLLFHDAVDSGGYGNHYPGIGRLVEEIARDDETLERRSNVGSIAHFTRAP
ncbi:MAG: class I SAM-dependent methyltransferase [Actinobacteria bacterium]|nr:class I SAM-dependent methyltransferase [Actinomycetota bacterium]